MSERDRDLEVLFGQLRRADAAHARPFGPTLAAASHYRGPRRPRLGVAFAAVATLLAVAAVVVATWIASRQRVPGALGDELAAAVQWRAPTDFLLEPPGWVLLRAVPTVGGALDVPMRAWSPGPMHERRNP